jgi:hypothetical protein
LAEESRRRMPASASHPRVTLAVNR